MCRWPLCPTGDPLKNGFEVFDNLYNVSLKVFAAAAAAPAKLK
jgi:hypothetical protein